MAGMVGAISNSVFSTAISQSPVTDWHYYGMSLCILQCSTTTV